MLNGSGSSRQRQGGDGRRDSYGRGNQGIDSKREKERLVQELKRRPEDIEKNLVDTAEKVILDLKDKIGDGRSRGKIGVTKTQLRKILTAVIALKNKVDVEVASAIAQNKDLGDMISDGLAGEIKFLKVTIIYQGTRDPKVKDFVDVAGLVGFVETIGNSISRFNMLNKYVEALVAYHKYYGGRD